MITFKLQMAEIWRCLALSNNQKMEEEDFEYLKELNDLLICNQPEIIQRLEDAVKLLQTTNDELRVNNIALQKQILDLTTQDANCHIHILYNNARENIRRLEKKCEDLKDSHKELENTIKEKSDKLNNLLEENELLSTNDLQRENQHIQRVQEIKNNHQAEIKNIQKENQQKLKKLNDKITELSNSNMILRTELYKTKDQQVENALLLDNQNQERINLLQNKLQLAEQQLKKYEELQTNRAAISYGQNMQANTTVYESRTNIEIVKESNYCDLNFLENLPDLTSNVNQYHNYNASTSASRPEQSTQNYAYAKPSSHNNLDLCDVIDASVMPPQVQPQSNYMVDARRMDNVYKKQANQTWVRSKSSHNYGRKSSETVVGMAEVGNVKRRKLYEDNDYFSEL